MAAPPGTHRTPGPRPGVRRVPIEATPLPPPKPPGMGPPPKDPLRAALVVARKVLTAVLALTVFIFAIALLKSGAGAVAPFARGLVQVDQPLHALGFGWFLSYLVLSGSPIAATALGLFAGGAIDQVGAFMMIAGSRLGASLIVLLIGFIYALRREHRHHHLSLHAGVLSLLVTYTIYAPGIVLGYFLLESRVLEPYSIVTPPDLLRFIDEIFGRGAEWLTGLLPHPLLAFVLGVAVILGAFKLFDLALPDIHRRAGRLGKMAERIYRPSVLFAFGFIVTLLTLSVSVSLSLLVPLTVKGLIRRENLIPYIMGANVSTFIDTLFASVVVGGAAAFTVVLAEMAGVAVVSIVVIAVAYTHFEESLYRVSHAILASRARLALFLGVVLICPVLLMLL